MNAAARKTLIDAGFSVEVDAHDWLGLGDEEHRIVETRLALARAIRRLRESAGMSQVTLAAKIGSSQSRVAKVESGAKGVSLDLSFRMLFAVGGRLSDLVKRERSQKPTRRRSG